MMANEARQHHLHEPYSSRNPVPNVPRFLAEQAKRITPAAKENKDTDKTRREVVDPTTKNEVTIQDVDADYAKAVSDPHMTVPIANLHGSQVQSVPSASPSGVTAPGTGAVVGSSKDQSPEEYRKTQDDTAPPDARPGTTEDVPLRGESTNVLFHPTPGVDFTDGFAALERNTSILCIGIIVGVIGLTRLFHKSGFLGSILTAILVSGGVWFWMKKIKEEAENIRWETEQRRGQAAQINLIPESVEWMNSLLKITWGLVNPDMFASMADTLEDVMQASVPGIIENVKVADIGQGTNPIRILSMRSLPDAEMGDLVPHAGVNSDKTTDQRKQIERQLEEDEGAEYYNLEVAFAYHAAPGGRGVSSRSHNMHLEVDFYLGIKGLFGIPLPIWVELKGLIGTVRLRIQMTPRPPFVKNVTFTLMGLPQVNVSAVPMTERGVNVLNLPLVSGFVNNSIAAAANEYVAPKSMSLEVGKLIIGDDVKKDTDAVGVLFVKIHNATGLSAQDRNGSSDTYITLAYSKYGKPMYSTRVIVKDLNPVWEESTCILVYPDQVKSSECLSVQLWDSDRFTADDLVGKIEFDLHDLILNGGKMQSRTDKLAGEKQDSEMPGELHWEVGYFAKADFNKKLRTHGEDIRLPQELREKPEFKDPQGQLDSQTESDTVHTPPDPALPTGIVSIIVHQIVNLEVEDITGTYGNEREFSPGQETGENKEEEGKHLPSAYCTILLNDQLIYKTRTKVVTSKPIFEAGTERFIRDWRNTIVTVTVRDQRMREHDPILGVVPLKLSEVFQTSSQVTRWFPLDAGLGFGKCLISILFRSIDLQLEKPLLGWDVGTFEFHSDSIIATGVNGSDFSSMKLKLRTGGSTGKVGRSKAKATENGVEWKCPGLRLPVKHRYMSPVVIEFHSRGIRNKPDAHAIVWLSTVVDNDILDFKLPIYKSDNAQRLTQNFILDPEKEKDLKVERVGYLAFKGRFRSGLDEDHAKFSSDNDSRETMETYEACVTDGLRGEIVKRQVGPAVQKLAEDAYGETPDVDSESDLEDSGTGRGTGMDEWRAGKDTDADRASGEAVRDPDVMNNDDWSKAFGEDPATLLRRREGRTSGGNQARPDTDDEDDDDSSDSDEEGSSGIVRKIKDYKANEKDLHRNHRGAMQWKPVRTMKAMKDQMKVGVVKAKNRFSMTAREPDLETET